MIRGWGRSLLFSIFVAAFIFSFLLICTSIECASASEPQIEVTPLQVEVLFDSERGSEALYPAEETITITNNGENTTVVNISHDPEIAISCPGTFSLPPGEREITIKAHYDADDKSYPLTINAGGVTKTVTVKVIYCAKLEVSPSSIVDFERVGSKESKESGTITISEKYKYKAAEGITIEKISGNDWVTIKGTLSTRIDKGSSDTIKFQIASEKDPIVKNEYSWKYRVEYTTSEGKRETITIFIEAYILMPPKLGRLDDEELEIKFDKPKGTVSKYDRYIDVPVRNLGDEPMHFSSSISESPGGGITIGIDPYSPKVVSKRGSENIKVHIIAPYDTPEGTYQGKLFIDTVEDKDGYVKITIKIIWPVDFTISSSSPYFTPSPPSIDFESLELRERGYEKKSTDITLTEFYGYKPVRNLRFSASGEYGNWLKEEMAFLEIPPGESGNITLKIEPGLEAVPKDYSWKYYIRAYEISAKRIDVKAKIVPMNIPEMIEYLNSFRESPLHDSYPSSEVIISNGVGMLEVIEESEIGAEDWNKIPVLMKGTRSLLSSLNDGVISSEEENYGKAVENLVSASVSTSTIGSNSELNNLGISGYAKDISTGADRTTEEVLIDEAKKLELRGWNIKKAVEHAVALDDISGLKEEENVLESALSYQYAATIYGLLNDKEGRIGSNYEESRLMDKHDELVSDATDLRIKAEKNIMNTEENDLIRIWNTYLLLNPYNYDTFSESYGSAEKYLEDALKNYKVAGESLMAEDTEKKLNEVKSEWRYILSLFFLACILYGAAFIYTINRIIMGTVAYMRDTYEREVGDIVVT